MFAIVFLIFILVPVIEISLFISVGDYLGLWPTIAMVFLTAFVGVSLVRSQGLQTLLSVQSRLQQGELPAQQIFEGVLLAAAGVLLFIPGFLTDAMGMIVLLPAPRRALAKYLMTKMVVKASAGFGAHQYQEERFTHRRNNDGNTFEGEYERKDDDNNNHLNKP